MTRAQKRLCRFAALIHAAFTSGRNSASTVELPTSVWQSCTELAHRLRRARLRGFRLAADVLQKDLGYAAATLVREVTSIESQLEQGGRVQRIATAGDIYHDLVALERDFDEVAVDCRNRQLSVTSEPIVLEGVYLGPFEIQWRWATDPISDVPSYRVVAKDPHPAEGRDNVTHPHVMDERLCEGEGRHAIARALAQGRVLDFFTLVAGILRTYNSESPFVELALWSGSACSDCGAAVQEEDSYSCQQCGDVVCSNCESLCSGCEEGYCSGCLGSCAACDETRCRRCLRSCQGCQAKLCSGCLDEHERCPACHEEEPIQTEPAEYTPSLASAPI